MGNSNSHTIKNLNKSINKSLDNNKIEINIEIEKIFKNNKIELNKLGNDIIELGKIAEKSIKSKNDTIDSLVTLLKSKNSIIHSLLKNNSIIKIEGHLKIIATEDKIFKIVVPILEEKNFSSNEHDKVDGDDNQIYKDTLSGNLLYAENLKKLTGPFPKFYGSFYLDDNTHVLVMERIRGTELSRIDFGGEKILDIFEQIINIHNNYEKHGIYFNDAHYNNIIITPEGKVYFIDFEKELKKKCGDSRYENLEICLVRFFPVAYDAVEIKGECEYNYNYLKSKIDGLRKIIKETPEVESQFKFTDPLLAIQYNETQSLEKCTSYYENVKYNKELDRFEYSTDASVADETDELWGIEKYKIAYRAN